ncbi:hypothetical protein CHS0354_010121 [Potamilus streckersoni]|uniref:LanC-like protein 2 n=1 Tax=Potamilus streckersoni TaxID=2493646 RepID=A0AAE0RSU8_9BIVA|nr:hypothetical protein CHS0354_010121 [Potamilus streckersoni]
MDKREFDNPFEDYSGETLLTSSGKLEESLASTLRKNIDNLLQNLHVGLADTDPGDYSVYSGTSGIAALYLHLANKLGDGRGAQYLQTALTYIKHPLNHLNGRRFSFVCGDAGPLALGAVIYSKLGQNDKTKDCINRLSAIYVTMYQDKSFPDEFLFGRVGYLFGLLFVQYHLGKDKIDNSLVARVSKEVLDSGRNLAQVDRSRAPLMYMWHEKYYLGAAHGLAGIFYMLMQVSDPSVQPIMTQLVKPCIDYMVTLQFPSGNCPSSLENMSSDKLVHWCHGAPGWIHTFVLAYKIFGDEVYLHAARRCADLIWKKGLLRKGYGICHGTTGNAYAFLVMFRITQDQKYLHRAWKFAEWCFDYGKHGCRTPDHPFSLFEGMAGTIYFLVDLLDPGNAKFPSYQLW